MRLETVWIVSDPTPLSELGDILFEQPIRTLHRQMMGISMGGDRNEWQTRNYTLWTDEAEARADAEARLAARPTRPPQSTLELCPTCQHHSVVNHCQESGTVFTSRDGALVCSKHAPKLYEVVRADGSKVKVTVPE